MPLIWVIVGAIVENVVLFVAVLGVGHWLVWRYRLRATVVVPEEVCRIERALRGLRDLEVIDD